MRASVWAPALFGSLQPFGQEHTGTLECYDGTRTRREGTEMSEQKAQWKRVYEAVNQGKLEVIDELIGANLVFNIPTVPGGKITGAEGYKQYIQSHRDAFPSLHVTIQDQIEDGDKVVRDRRVDGTHKGAEIGVPPTGKDVTVTRITN